MLVAVVLALLLSTLIVGTWRRTQTLRVVSLVVALGVGVTAPAIAGAASASFRITNTALKQWVNSPVLITTAGGSGSGAVAFHTTGTGCTVSAAGTLKATAATTCSTWATKAASGSSAATTSAKVKFVFQKSSATLHVSNTVLTGEVGIALTVTASGSAGSGAVSYTANGTCSINSSTGVMTAFDAGWCPVFATQAASRGHKAMTSPTVNFLFAPGPQPTLTIANTVLSSSTSSSLYVFTNGGAGVTSPTYALASGSGAGCTLDSSTGELSDANSESCIVVATSPASSGYLVATSAPVTFTFSDSGGAGGSGGASYANPDVATLTSLTGNTGSVVVGTSATTSWITAANGYEAGDALDYYYVAPSSTITMTWHVVDSSGNPMADQSVTLEDNLAYGCAYLISWQQSTLNANPGCGAGSPGTLSGTTDSSGNVTFTLNETYQSTGSCPSNASSDVAANAIEHNAEWNPSGTNAWTRFGLEIGSGVFTGGNSANTTVQTTLVDTILIPSNC
jgi:hypothetical protein